MSSGISKRFTRMLNRSKSSKDGSTAGDGVTTNSNAGTPEGDAARSVRLFCDSGSTNNAGDEVLHLPVIVEAAESSPAAAAAAAQQIRKFMSKEWSTKPYVQYNAIMLIRILADNPGLSFTRNFDKAFVGNVKELLRHGKDASTQQILRETLDALESTKQNQPGVDALVTMWRKEKGQGASFGPERASNPTSQLFSRAYGFTPEGYSQPQERETRGGLPPPVELASRVEEARNTAKILLQLIQSTPPEEVLVNELVQEFRGRCQTAQRSMESYINCQNPPPDDATMLTLIETNEQLSLASTRYQRCALSARRAMGMAPSPNSEVQAAQNGTQNGTSAFASAPTLPLVPQQSQSLFAKSAQPNSTSAFANSLTPMPSQNALNRLNSREQSHDGPQSKIHDFAVPRPKEDPFADPVPNNADTATEPHHQLSQGIKAFNISSEPTYPSGSEGHDPSRNTTDLNNAYANTYTPVSSASHHTNDTSDPYAASPQAARSSWRNNNGTSSYTGRQTSAANGLTMHGAAGPEIAEIDGYSGVGRINSGDHDDSESAYSTSPVEGRR